MRTFYREFHSTNDRARWWDSQKQFGLLQRSHPSAVPGVWQLRGERQVQVQSRKVWLSLADSDLPPAGFDELTDPLDERWAKAPAAGGEKC